MSPTAGMGCHVRSDGDEARTHARRRSPGTALSTNLHRAQFSSVEKANQAHACRFSMGTACEQRCVDPSQLESSSAELVLVGYAWRGVCRCGSSVS